ncbi:unnamed protein product [Lymnaea stagnalis]|uniref:Uncharacterized protein n=1 Tax=Lymnaea stagnalis TaxID=6523 RepID=A0AAV2HKW0_LYMST
MDFVVSTAYFDFGMKEEDPVEKLKVYTKNNPTEAKLLTKKEISRILGPVTYKEVVIRVYSRSLQEHIQKAIYLASKKWFSSWNYKVEMKQSEERPRKKPRMKPISPESLTTPENENLVR